VEGVSSADTIRIGPLSIFTTGIAVRKTYGMSKGRAAAHLEKYGSIPNVFN